MYVAKWTNNAGTDDTATKTWTAALDWASGLNWLGRTGWRLPNQPGDTGGELRTICYNKASLGSYQSDFYWSSTELDASHAWVVRFSDCFVGFSDKTPYEFYVRAVLDSVE